MHRESRVPRPDQKVERVGSIGQVSSHPGYINHQCFVHGAWSALPSAHHSCCHPTHAFHSQASHGAYHHHHRPRPSTSPLLGARAPPDVRSYSPLPPGRQRSETHPANHRSHLLQLVRTTRDNHARRSSETAARPALHLWSGKGTRSFTRQGNHAG